MLGYCVLDLPTLVCIILPQAICITVTLLRTMCGRRFAILLNFVSFRLIQISGIIFNVFSISLNNLCLIMIFINLMLTPKPLEMCCVSKMDTHQKQRNFTTCKDYLLANIPMLSLLTNICTSCKDTHARIAKD